MSSTGMKTPSNLGSFILAWLFCLSEGDTPNECAKALGTFLEQSSSASAWRQAVNDEISALTRAGSLVGVRRAAVMLTESGRRAAMVALATFGVKSPRAKADWTSVRKQIRSYVLRCWIEGAAAAPAVPREDAPLALNAPSASLPIARPSDLPEEDGAFAARVLKAARASKTGRFGDDKVFISHVLRQLTDEGARVNDAEAFKDRLVAVHRRGLLSLSRADLVEAMDPKDVDASEARYLSATFHFVRV